MRALIRSQPHYNTSEDSVATQFTQTSLSTAISQLAQRLNDTANVFWSQAELTLYLQQSLRQWNSLCWFYKTDFAFNNASPTNVWSSLATLANSPRLRTITDTYCYTELEYMLLEKPSGGVWTGTNQFGISVLSQALQRRRDEMLQISNANQGLTTGIPLTPGTRRTYLADTVIDVARVRYIPSVVAPATQPPPPVTLYRDDTVAQEFFESPLYQQAPGTPNTFSLSSEPPLAFDVDIPPAQPGTYEAVVLSQGTPFAPPAATLLGIPDDFAWVAEFGALADLLGQESESTDRQRADYCLKRYQDGLNLMLKTPWIMLGSVNGVAVTVDAFNDADRYDPNWDSNPSGFGPYIVTGGIDWIGAPTGTSTGVTVLGNIPVPSSGSDFLQIPPSMLDTLYDLVQARCLFKIAGAEWQAGLELEQRAIQACSAENSRLKSLGSFSDCLDQRGWAQDRVQNRYNNQNDESSLEEKYAKKVYRGY